MIESYADHQRRARRQSWLLVALFVAGFAATILSFWLIVSGGLALRHDVEWRDSVQEWRLLGIVTGCIVLMVLYGSIRTLWRLRHGGPAIAEMLGGVEIARDTYDADERKLLNVVEEMSLASGLPMPRVYLLADDTINAFAAGHRPGNAVVGFTRGAVERLTRDELQAVAAHEFSHIYHGDPRINARTVAAIGGIMAIGVFGWVLLRYLGPAMLRAESRGGRGKKKEGGGAIVVILAGLVMWIVGSVGVLFGRLIQAAISRRREYLADASAVDYTRNPDGIAGALRKIRDQGSAAVASESASELNHFFFASSVRSLFATHPPLDRRIERAVAMGAKATWEPSMPERPPASSQTDALLASLKSSFLAGFGRGVPRPAAVPSGGAILWLADWSAELRGKIRTRREPTVAPATGAGVDPAGGWSTSTRGGASRHSPCQFSCASAREPCPSSRRPISTVVKRSWTVTRVCQTVVTRACGRERCAGSRAMPKRSACSKGSMGRRSSDAGAKERGDRRWSFSESPG